MRRGGSGDEQRAGRRYLAASALGAVTVANAWRPFARVGYPVIPAYLAGILPAELPLATAAGYVGASAWLTRDGALHTRPGRAGLALTAASVAALVALDRSARRDADVLERALVECLGAGYPAGAHPPLVADLHPSARWATPLPRTGRRSPMLAVRDVAYGDHRRRNLLDVWRRPDLPAGGRAPVVLQIHGGAWIGGSRLVQGVPLLERLARRGWVGVSTTYRVSPRATWPDHIVDVKRAIAWVRANIADHGGDPTFVAVTGGSAGAHLAAVAALSPGYAPFQPGFEDADTRVQAAVPLYGAYDLTDLEGTGRRDAIEFWERVVVKARYDDDPSPWAMASPVLMARPDAPPFFVIHGTADALVRVESARLLVARLRAAGADRVCFAELPHARHAFDVFDTPRTRSTIDAIERFLLVAYGEHGRHRMASATERARR